MKTAYCFDLDGTVTVEEMLPMLSKEIGLYEEIEALTEATIKGLIPFRKSFLLRCRLLSEIPVSRVQAIVSRIGLHEMIVEFIKGKPLECFIVTGNLDVWIKPLLEKLGCASLCSIAAVQGDRLKEVQHVLNKGAAVQGLRAQFERIVSIGDGMGDVSMFEASDVRIAFGGVHPPIQSLIQFSDYVTFSQRGLCQLLNVL